MRTHHIALCLIKDIGSFVAGLENLTGKWTAMGFPFVLGVVLDDDFLVHDDSSLSG